MIHKQQKKQDMLADKKRQETESATLKGNILAQSVVPKRHALQKIA